VVLFFDANWHLVKLPGTLYKQYLNNVRACIKKYGSDYSGRTDPDIVNNENFRVTPPNLLGNLQRPDWDVGLLNGLDFSEISYERDIIDELWADKVKLIFGTTPMFMIRTTK